MIPGNGDHVVLDVHGESIIVVRNTEGVIRAFYNVCRHRGARLCAASESGSSQNQPVGGGIIGKNSILCPYHAWSYDLDGQLQRAPHMSEDFGFNKQDVQLYPVGVQTWGGFIFVSLRPDVAPDFNSMIQETAEKFVRYPLKDLRIAETIRYEVDANWKVLCENYNECYHCGPVHPELCRVVPAFREFGGGELDWDRGIPHREGAVTFSMDGTTSRRPFPGLNDDEKVRHKAELMYPNLWISLACEHAAIFVLYANEPGHTTVDCHFLFEPYEMEKPGFDPSDVVDFWDLVNRQDWIICERVQQGMSSRVHHSGIFSPMEDSNLDIRRYVTSRIGDFVEE
jgi:Rieske 2Fe-2S family protein